MPLIPALATQKQMDLWEFQVGLVSSGTLRVLHKRETLSLKKERRGEKKERRGKERRGEKGKKGEGKGKSIWEPINQLLYKPQSYSDVSYSQMQPLPEAWHLAPSPFQWVWSPSSIFSYFGPHHLLNLLRDFSLLVSRCPPCVPLYPSSKDCHISTIETLSGHIILLRNF